MFWWVILVVGNYPLEGQYSTQAGCVAGAIYQMEHKPREQWPAQWKCIRKEFDRPPSENYSSPQDREMR